MIKMIVREACQKIKSKINDIYQILWKQRGATLDFLLNISANILVIIGFRHPDQIAKVCTLTCFYTLVALNSNFKTLIDGVILAKQASSSESNQTLYWWRGILHYFTLCHSLWDEKDDRVKTCCSFKLGDNKKGI